MNDKIARRLETVQCAAANEMDLFLYGNICDAKGWFYEEDEIITPQHVIEVLKDLKTDVLNVHINSYGGSGTAAVAIYNLLTQHGAEINTYVDGIAASGGSLIAMAGKKVYMPTNTRMYIHNAWTFAIGSAAELRKEADDLEKAEASMYETYMAHFKGTREELKALIDEGSELNADDCLTLGLCTDVIPVKKEGDDGGAMTKKGILSKYKKNQGEDEKPDPKAMKVKVARAMAAYLDSLQPKGGQNE